MRFILVSKHGDGVGLIPRLQEEGNEVFLFIRDKQFHRVYEGLVPKVKHIEDELTDETVLIYDHCGAGKEAEKYLKKYHVFGASKYSDRREMDRAFASRLVTYAGLDVPETIGPLSLKEAASKVKENRGGWALKVSATSDSKKELASTSSTVVSEDSNVLYGHIQRLLRLKDWKGAEVVLQRKVEGIEVSTEAWFSHGKLIPGSLNSTIETKRKSAGDLGPNTGCQSSLVWPWRSENELTKKVFTPKLLRVLEKEEHSGPLDINTIISPDGKVYWLEFTERFGYSAIYALAEMIRMELGKLLSDAARGTLSSLPLDAGFGGAVRVTIPPFPFEDPDEDNEIEAYEDIQGTPLGKLPQPDKMILLDVMRDPELDLCVAGCDGVVLEVVGHEMDLPKLETGIRTILEGMTLPNKDYRVDFFDRAMKEFPRVRDFAGVSEGEIRSKLEAAKPIKREPSHKSPMSVKESGPHTKVPVPPPSPYRGPNRPSGRGLKGEEITKGREFNNVGSESNDVARVTSSGGKAGIAAWATAVFGPGDTKPKEGPKGFGPRIVPRPKTDGRERLVL